MSYEKQTFIDWELDENGNVVTEGTTLSAEHLRHIEDGIAANAQELENKQPKGNYLTKHQPIKTINGQSMVGSGDIVIPPGCGLTEEEKNLILALFENTAYTSDAMGDIISQLKNLWNVDDEPVYMWVANINGSAANIDSEAILDTSNGTRAMCLAKDAGVTLRYGNGYHTATTESPYSPVVIPEGAVSVTVKCQGFRIGFNELRLQDEMWYRLFSSDSSPVADEATYAFRSAEASGLYIKLRHITDDQGTLPALPETVDITFNY